MSWTHGLSVISCVGVVIATCVRHVKSKSGNGGASIKRFARVFAEASVFSLATYCASRYLIDLALCFALFISTYSSTSSLRSAQRSAFARLAQSVVATKMAAWNYVAWLLLFSLYVSASVAVAMLVVRVVRSTPRRSKHGATTT